MNAPAPIIPQDKPAVSAQELSRFLSSSAADPAMVWPRFAHWLLVDPTDGVLRFVTAASPQMAIWAVADLYSRWSAGQKPARMEWLSLTVIVASFGPEAYDAARNAITAAAFASDAAANPAGNGRAQSAYYAARAARWATDNGNLIAVARLRQAEKLRELTGTEVAA